LDRKIKAEWDMEGNMEVTEAGIEWKHHSVVEKMGMEKSVEGTEGSM
jgi:hypothetical protein